MATLAKLLVALGLDASEYDEGLDKAEGKADTFGSKIGGFLGNAMKLGLAATAGGVVASIGAIVKGVASNAEFERYETQFGVLLGSTEAAKARLADLAKFGASTPFELPQVVNADKILQGFGLHSQEAAKKFGFSGEEIRTIAGDVASGAGASFEDMSLLLGKFSTGATGEAISRMAELGITSRDELTKMGLEFDKSGALLSPLPESMNVILSLMKEKYGGMMQAQSATFEGMMSNLQDWVSGTLRTLSAPIFEVVKAKLGDLLAFLSDPSTQATLNSIATALAEGVGKAIDWISNTGIPMLMTAWATVQPALAATAAFITSTLVPAFNKIVEFITTYARPILAGLAAVLTVVVVPAFIAWGVAAASAATATIIALAPVLIPLAAIGLAVGLLYAAWESNFLGIRDILVGIWEGYLAPIFNDAVAWLQVNIPIAIQTLSDFWNNTLLPALRATWQFIQANVIPIFVAMVNVHIAAFKVAIQALANFWANILRPAIVAVWNFLNTYVIPLFRAIVSVNIAAFNLALRLLAAVWQNVLLPQIKAAWAFIQTYLIPIFTMLYYNTIEKGLKPALQSIAFFILGTLIPQFMAIKASISGNLNPALESAKGVLGKVKDAFGAIDNAIKSTIKWIQDVADKLSSISIPSWLQGHSPPPMADWFDFIGKSAKSAGDLVGNFGAMVNSTNDHVQTFTGNLDKVVNTGTLPNTDAWLRNRRIDGASGGVASLGDQVSANTTNSISIEANYAHQPERTVRDEIRMQSMILGINPTG